MIVRDYILSNGLYRLQTDKYVKVNRHQDYPNLIGLCYSHTQSKTSDKIASKCRGLILDEEDNYKIVCYPFDRFPNYNKQNNTILKEPIKYYCKEDGSLFCLYFYCNKWLCSSKGLPDANGYNEKYDGRMYELFWEVFNNKNYQLPLDTNKCYIFELTTPYNFTPVIYNDSSLKLIGVRNLDTFKEEPIEINKHNWETPQEYFFASLEEAAKSSNYLKHNVQEGYVAVDSEFNRLKIKGVQYVAASHIGNKEVSTNKVLEVIKQGEGSEFVTYFPEWEPFNKAYIDLIDLVIKEYDQYKNIINDAEFYNKVKHLNFSKILGLKRRSPQSSVEELLAKTNLKTFKLLLKNTLKV